MIRFRPRFRLFVIAALATFLATPALARTSLEGRWRLVEQRYGAGGSNLANLDAPVRLEFRRQGAGLTCRIWAGHAVQQARAWPAFVSATPPAAVMTDELAVDPARASARARYRVDTSDDDDLILHIVEDYRVEPSSGALVGTVTVTLVDDGKPRGSYVLHRRFEKEP